MKAVTPLNPVVSTLNGQTVFVNGGSAGIGLETARRASAEGVKVILTARNPEPLKRAAIELDALSFAAFDATDFKLLEHFFDSPSLVGHILVTGPGSYYAPLTDFDFRQCSPRPRNSSFAPYSELRETLEIRFDRVEPFFLSGAQADGPRELEWSSFRRQRLLFRL